MAVHLAVAGGVFDGVLFSYLLFNILSMAVKLHIKMKHAKQADRKQYTVELQWLEH